jgi:hypothetical protein
MRAVKTETCLILKRWRDGHGNVAIGPYIAGEGNDGAGNESRWGMQDHCCDRRGMAVSVRRKFEDFLHWITKDLLRAE